MRAHQIRLFFSSMAYVLLEALRRLGMAGTELACAQCQTIRLKLLKIGALVRVTVRKVWVRLSSGSPYAAVFWRVHANLTRLRPLLRCGSEEASMIAAGSRPRGRGPTIGVRAEIAPPDANGGGSRAIAQVEAVGKRSEEGNGVSRDDQRSGERFRWPSEWLRNKMVRNSG